MINSILNKVGIIITYIGLCSADSKNLLIPVIILAVGILLFKITYDDSEETDK